MSASEQLERDAERSRTNVAASLTELRERLRPGQLTDDVLGYAGGQTGQLLETAGKQIAKNPIAAALIGAGVAYLFFGDKLNARATRLPRARGYDGNGYPYGYEGHDYEEKGALGRVADKVGDAASSAYRGVKNAASSAVDGVTGVASSAADAVTGAAGSAYRSANRTAHDVRDTVADTAQSVGDTISSAAEKAADIGAQAGEAASYAARKGGEAARRAADYTAQGAEDTWAYLKDQPLILMGIGLALGSALGTALPRTKIEDRLMGDTADRLKGQADELLGEGISTARQGAEKVLDAATEATKSQLGSRQQDPLGASQMSRAQPFTPSFGAGSERDAQTGGRGASDDRTSGEEQAVNQSGFRRND